MLAGDLAAAAPEWSAVAPETPLALAPAPGVQRIFRLPELRRLAQRWNLAAQPDRELCVTRPVAVPIPAVLLAAMRRQLPGGAHRNPRIQPPTRAPGRTRIPAQRTAPVLRRRPLDAAAVKYAGQHRFALWARVKVLVPVARVVATEAISPRPRPGRRARCASNRARNSRLPAIVASLEEVAGKVARRSIAAGTPLRAEWLEPAKVVTRGDTVQVEIVNGAAHLKLDGVAASSGAVGDTILVLNPDSKRQFRARVLSPGKVLVTRGNS